MPLSREDAELWAATRLARWEAGHGRRHPTGPPAWKPHTPHKTKEEEW